MSEVKRVATAQAGYTLMELIVVVAILGAITGVAMIAGREFSNPAMNGAAELTAFIKKSRSKALAATLAYTIRPSSTTSISATSGTSCAATQSGDPTMALRLPAGARLDSTGWSICYNSRGLSSSSVDIVVRDDTRIKTVRVVLGGAVKVL